MKRAGQSAGRARWARRRRRPELRTELCAGADQLGALMDPHAAAEVVGALVHRFKGD
ncbi:hypothetical protein SNL152K_5810 [Streptomyces sp. NL15-2K]|nr:hypothetical protein SNL152K_5810 [Streptomyces sp. NL15-2K]